MNYKETIERLQTEITACDRECSGIVNDRNIGILPRGLHIDNDNNPKNGAIVCGLNPGRSNHVEREYYLQNDCSVDAIRSYYFANSHAWRYFTNTRRFLASIGHDGPILWTNIAKCEASLQQESIGFVTHPQTFRNCANLFLISEITSVPQEWILIACGKDAFTALSYLFPSRRLIGIPHPTGAGPNFRRLFDNGDQLRPQLLNEIEVYFQSEPNGALWLA